MYVNLLHIFCMLMQTGLYCLYSPAPSAIGVVCIIPQICKSPGFRKMDCGGGMYPGPPISSELMVQSHLADLHLKGTVSPDIVLYFRVYEFKSVISVRPLMVFNLFTSLFFR
jgi:hypothetical protein